MEKLLVLIFFLLLLIWQYFLFLQQKTFVIHFCDCFCVYYYLFGRFKFLENSSDWIRQILRFSPYQLRNKARILLNF